MQHKIKIKTQVSQNHLFFLYISHRIIYLFTTSFMNNRASTADLLKGIAVMGMIQIHILELFASNLCAQSAIGKSLFFLGGPPVAPVFALLMGYFLAASQKSTAQLMIRGLGLFLLGMCLNLSLNANLLFSVSIGIYKINTGPYIFGADMLQFAGLSTILLSITKKILKRNLILTGVLTFLAAFLGRYLLHFIPEHTVWQYLTAFFYGSVRWSYFPLFPWVAYPLCGLFFYEFSSRMELAFLQDVKAWVIILISGIIFLAISLPYALKISATLPAYYHHGLLFFLWTIAFIGLYVFLVNEINKRMSGQVMIRYLKWLGKNVTLLYVMQWILIGNMATNIYKTISSPVYLTVSFIGILFLSSCLAYFFLQLKVAFKSEKNA